MKKSRFLAIFLSILLTAAVFQPACGNRSSQKYPEIIWSDEYIESQDFNYTAFAWGSGIPCVTAVTEDGIYLKAGQYLFFADKTTKKAHVLCSKLLCMHNHASTEKIPECDAFAFTGAADQPFVGVFRDHIFFSGLNCDTGRNELFTADLDGTNRRTILKDIHAVIKSSFRIHRGMLYYAESGVSIDGESQRCLMGIPLDTADFRPQEILKGSTGSKTFTALLPYGNYIYFNQSFLVDREDGHKKSVIKYYRYHLLEGTTEELTDYVDGDLMGIIDRKLVFYDGLDYYELDPETHEMKLSGSGLELFQKNNPGWNCYASNFADNIYFFCCDHMNEESDPPQAEVRWERIVVNEYGEEVCSIDEPCVIDPYSACEIIHMDGEEYYLHYPSSGHKICLYKTKDLLQGSKKPIVLLNMSDLSPAFSYTVKE